MASQTATLACVRDTPTGKDCGLPFVNLII